MNLPSPEQELHHPLFEEKGLSVWIKRDDLIHPFVSGNKWRKLEPIIEVAKQAGVHTLVSFGGAYSNHLLALAASAASFGFKSRGIVRGDRVSNPLLRLCSQFGMELEFMTREAFREARATETHLKFIDGELWIPEGANCLEGRAGMASLWKELKQSYTHVLDSVGSGTSARGLHANKPDASELLAIMAVKDARLAEQLREEGIQVFTDYARGGFAKMDAGLFDACRAFTSHSGILLDPVYTGKQWMALLDLVQNDFFSPEQRLLFIHSGGLAGWMSNPERA